MLGDAGTSRDGGRLGEIQIDRCGPCPRGVSAIPFVLKPSRRHQFASSGVHCRNAPAIPKPVAQAAAFQFRTASQACSIKALDTFRVASPAYRLTIRITSACGRLFRCASILGSGTSNGCKSSRAAVAARDDSRSFKLRLCTFYRRRRTVVMPAKEKRKIAPGAGTTVRRKIPPLRASPGTYSVEAVMPDPRFRI